jgi:DNA-binding IclR family transcriptional regulator
MEATMLTSVDRALAVIEYLADCPEPQALSGIARDLDLSKSGLHRILTTLKVRGFVVQEEVGARYARGPAIARIADRSRQVLDVAGLCRPSLQALWHQTEENAMLAVLRDDTVLVVERIESPRPVVVRSIIGAAMPLHAVAVGKALLASLPTAELERILTTGLPRFTQSTATDPDLLRLELAEVRANGYAVNREGYRREVSGVAAPIRNSQGVVAAIGVCFPDARFAESIATLRRLVPAAAQSASDALLSRTPADAPVTLA